MIIIIKSFILSCNYSKKSNANIQFKKLFLKIMLKKKKFCCLIFYLVFEWRNLKVIVLLTYIFFLFLVKVIFTFILNFFIYTFLQRQTINFISQKYFLFFQCFLFWIELFFEFVLSMKIWDVYIILLFIVAKTYG